MKQVLAFTYKCGKVGVITVDDNAAVNNVISTWKRNDMLNKRVELRSALKKNQILYVDLAEISSIEIDSVQSGGVSEKP